MGGFRRVQMGGLVAWVGCMGGLRDGVGMGPNNRERIYSQPPAGWSQAPHV